MKSYGQFCGLTRAAEILGERWTLVVLRDLLVSPKRFNELRHGNPGIPSNLLATRLKELEAAGVVERALEGRAVTYRLTSYGRDLEPILNALGLWGARQLDQPLSGELPTDNSLAAALLSSRTDAVVAPFSVSLTAGPASAHAEVLSHGVAPAPGPLEDADLQLSGPGLRRLLATGDPDSLRAEGALDVRGSEAVLRRFTRAFRAPLDAAA